MPIEGPWLYVLIVATLGLAVVLRVAVGLRRIRALRILRVGQRRRFEPIPTETPLEDPKESCRPGTTCSSH